MRVLVFGDSITYETSLPGDNWPAYLYQEFKQRIVSGNSDANVPEIYNLGISGDNSSGVAKRLAPEIEARKWKDDELAVVIFIGINDSQIIPGKEYSTPEKYRSNLQEILSKSSIFTDRILFIGSSAVDETRSNPVPWDNNISYTNQRIGLFEEQLTSFVKQNNLRFVPLYEKFIDRPDLLYDGVHPSIDGHKFIAETVKPAIEDLVK